MALHSVVVVTRPLITRLQRQSNHRMIRHRRLLLGIPRPLSRSLSTSMVFQGQVDRYKGITVQLDDNHLRDQPDERRFEDELQESLTSWRDKKLNISWFKVPLGQSQVIPHLAKQGYVFHNARHDQAVMYKWLADDQPDRVPKYAFTNIGVGGLVTDNEDNVLVIKERTFIGQQMWKFPGGYAEPGEEYPDTAIREVLEETGIRCRFESVVCFRQMHRHQFGCADIYMVVHLVPVDELQGKEVKKCQWEVADCCWMPINELIKELSPFNKFVLDRFLENRRMGVKMGRDMIDSVVKDTKHSVYSVVASESGKKEQTGI